MQMFKTVLTRKQLAAALIVLDRDATLLLRQYGASPVFRASFAARADELLDTVSPRDIERASAGIEQILLDHGVGCAVASKGLAAAA